MGKLRPEDILLREQIKKRITELRESIGQNKSGLSDKIEVDRQNFQPWEKLNISRGPSIYSINRICKAYNISIKDFFDSAIFKNSEDA